MENYIPYRQWTDQPPLHARSQGLACSLYLSGENKLIPQQADVTPEAEVTGAVALSLKINR